MENKKKVISKLTWEELDFLIDTIKPLEDELGMDITLLIDKLEEMQEATPHQNSVVDCIWYSDED